MEEMIFNSSLSEREIEKNFENIDFFSGIMSGLEEAMAYESGTAKSATIARKRSLPTVNSVDVRKVLNMTQKEFAKVIGVSPRTVEAWEIGRSTPTPTARNLLYLIYQDPTLVSELMN